MQNPSLGQLTHLCTLALFQWLLSGKCGGNTGNGAGCHSRGPVGGLQRLPGGALEAASSAASQCVVQGWENI